MLSPLGRLWRGELPLADAFWTWAVLVALLVNGTTTAGFVALIMAGWPISALIVGYAFSVPYNVVAGVGVWRSAARYDGPSHWAMLARILAVIGLSLLSLT
jgi:hypothetical protein